MGIVERLRDPKPPHYGKCIQAADEIERLRVALDMASIRLAHLAGQIEAGFNISGTLRADQAMKARHMADEARAALKAAQEVKTIESAEHLKEGR